jgi:hypothetical protein
MTVTENSKHVITAGSLGPGSLGHLVEEVAASAVVAQVAALGVAAGTNVKMVNATDNTAANRVQERIKETADSYLKQGVQGLIFMFTSILAAQRFMESAAKSDPFRVALGAHLGKTLNGPMDRSRQLAGEAENLKTAIKGNAQELEKCLDEEIERLTGKGGRVKEVQKELEELQKEATAILENIVKKSHDAGKGVKDILDDLKGMFNPEKKKEGGTTKPEETGAAEAGKDPAGAGEPLGAEDGTSPLDTREGIDTIGRMSVKALTQALRDNVKKRGVLHQELARHDMALSVNAAVRYQVTSFDKAVTRYANAVETLDRGLEGAQRSIDQLVVDHQADGQESIDEFFVEEGRGEWGKVGEKINTSLESIKSVH